MGQDRKLWFVMRLSIAGIIAAHGWARWFTGGVEPFGSWLVSQGVPFGLFVAWTITALEIVGSVALAAGRYTFLLTLMFSAIYLVGIALVHWKAGWFVVGLGRNGMEFSVLLIVGLLCVGLAHRRSR
jgi:putative oxidoreductase